MVFSLVGLSDMVVFIVELPGMDTPSWSSPRIWKKLQWHSSLWDSDRDSPFNEGTLHAVPNHIRLRSGDLLCPCLQGHLATVGVFGMIFSSCPCMLGHLTIVGNFGMVFYIVGLSGLDYRLSGKLNRRHFCTPGELVDAKSVSVEASGHPKSTRNRSLNPFRTP